MEAYTTAELELVTIDEDVIAASTVNVVCYICQGDPSAVNSTGWVGVTVCYSNGDSANYSYGSKEYDEYAKYCD